MMSESQMYSQRFRSGLEVQENDDDEQLIKDE